MVYLITQQIQGSGKTTVALALSAKLSKKGRKVLLIDCDRNRQTIAKKLSLKQEKGINEVKIGDIQMDVAFSYSQGVNIPQMQKKYDDIVIDYDLNVKKDSAREHYIKQAEHIILPINYDRYYDHSTAAKDLGEKLREATNAKDIRTIGVNWSGQDGTDWLLDQSVDAKEVKARGKDGVIPHDDIYAEMIQKGGRKPNKEEMERILTNFSSHVKLS